MAVTTTVQDVLNGAYGKSLKNQPGAIATEATELINVTNRAHRGIYSFSARINPIFFANQLAIVPSPATRWARPEEAEAIVRIEDSALAEVVVVPLDDRLAEPQKLSVYEFGQNFDAITNTAGTPTGNLTFWFSARPTLYTLLADLLSSDWREEYNELLILEVAIYIAAKDGRLDEVGFLVGERDRWASLLGAFLQHSTSNQRRRLGHLHQMNAETVQSLIPLFFATPNQPRGVTGGG